MPKTKKSIFDSASGAAITQTTTVEERLIEGGTCVTKVTTTRQVKVRKVDTGGDGGTHPITLMTIDGTELPDGDFDGRKFDGGFKPTKRKKPKVIITEVTDDDEQPKKSWWRRFKSWLSGGNKDNTAILIEEPKPKPTKSKTQPVGSQDDVQFEKDCLKQHNHYRAIHRVPPLKLNPTLTAIAKEWAQRCAALDVMQHRPNNQYGENIFMKWSSNPSFNIRAEDAVDAWYNEIKLYTFGVEPTSTETGHFTQLVWKESKEIGIGKARSSNNKIYVVANYNPPGNYVGRYRENVPPPKK